MTGREEFEWNNWSAYILSSFFSQLVFLKEFWVFCLLYTPEIRKVLIKRILESNGVSYRVSETMILWMIGRFLVVFPKSLANSRHDHKGDVVSSR